MHVLFPTLPPELRNFIYAYASATDENAATTRGLPFTTKTYDTSHTKVVICPVHTGNLSLLALQKYNFQEGHEYHSWLMAHGVQIRIAILFKGDVSTYIQKHWDDRMSASIRKLIKKYPWMANVAHWDVKVLWDANVGSMERRPGKAAAIVNGMLATLLGFQEIKGRRTRGDVSVQFHIPHAFAAAKRVYGVEFGLESFLKAQATTSSGKETREVTTGPLIKKEEVEVTKRFHAVPDPFKERDLIAVENEVVAWSQELKGTLVMRSVRMGGNSSREILRCEEKVPQRPVDWRMALLLCECSGVEAAKVL
jgi:hypothetical protein